LRSEEGTVQERGKELEERTATFASNVLRFVRSLPKATPEQVLGRQLLKAGTAVGASYRTARRSRSRREFLARMDVAVHIARSQDLLRPVVSSRRAGSVPTH